ncbi:unnamed protein product [Rotaria sordida]|uniref:Uncharacterized protein n=2 Tax=Rotaria sordida TaxID=392033 RepID=A0A818PMQ9_9BILA|nr:unnamed protein product [Rotaria sordida]CAF3625940.1 unnamed protein product [Rotaria sordida]
MLLCILVEIVFDPDTGKQILILKKEVPKTPPIIQSDIAIDDFELVTDEKTGETVLRLKADIAARKGLTGLAKTNFEVVVDPTTGQTVIRIKDDGTNQTNRNRIEIITDAITGKQTIRMIGDDDNDESNEPIITMTENDIDLNDFERIIDPKTGREILRMKADVLKAKGLEELANAEFEIVIDAITGQSRIVLKTPSSDLSGGTNTTFEVVVDIVTGKQKIIKRTITEQEKDNVDIIESQLNVDDFERVIDPNTGLEVLRLKKGAAARKGLTDLLDVEFEMVTDANGKQTIAIKGGGNQGNAGDAKFELITDASGRTTIKVKKERPPTPELEITEKPIDINDFEEVIDSKTGMKVLKLKVDVAKRAGMMELLDAQFETYIDEKTGKQAIRVKQIDGSNGPDDIKFEIVTDASGKQVLRMVQEIPKTIEVTNVDVNVNDFEEVIDVKTGKKVLRMKKEIAKRKGFVDMDNVDFEFVIDEKTGQQIIQIKGGTGKITKGNTIFEMVIDPKTGQQTLRMKQEVEVKYETIENDLVHEDFEEFIDEITGERILKLTAEAAARKGLNDLRDIEFEIYKDPTTGQEQIRMKGGNQTGKLDGDQKFEVYIDKKTGLPKVVLKRPKGRTPPPVEASIDVNDFEKVIDPITGKEFYRLTNEAVRRKGLTNVKDMEFDMEIDETTGKAVMKPKVSVIGGQKVEIIIDPQTGEQSIRIIPQKTIERMATITTSIDLDKDAFTIHIDPTTGKEVISLSKDLIENYGLENIEFEQVIDETTGQTIYRMKPAIGKDGKIYELITDPTTGKQSLQVKETVTQEQLTNLIQSREAKGLRIPRATSGHTKISGANNEESFLPSGISTRTKKKPGIALSPDDNMTSPTDGLTDENRRQSQIPSKSRPIRVKSPSGQDYDIEWTSDDEKELDGLSVYEQRRRKEQILAEKKRKVAEMKRQQELAIQNRLKKQRESLVDIIDHSSGLLNPEEQDRERDLRKLDSERGGLTDEEYQERRKKLFAERTRVLKAAYDRKMDRLKRQTGIPDGGYVDGEQAAELEAQIRAEEDLLLSMMNPEEREDYIRARNEERARQRLLAERERMKREEELQTALAETKRMAAIRAAEIMAKELQKRSNNSMYAELKDLVTEQKVSRAFTYSYFSLLQFLTSSVSNPAD